MGLHKTLLVCVSGKTFRRFVFGVLESASRRDPPVVCMGFGRDGSTRLFSEREHTAALPAPPEHTQPAFPAPLCPASPRPPPSRFAQPRPAPPRPNPALPAPRFPPCPTLRRPRSALPRAAPFQPAQPLFVKISKKTKATKSARSPRDKTRVNRMFCSSTGLQGISFVRACGETSRTVFCSALTSQRGCLLPRRPKCRHLVLPRVAPFRRPPCAVPTQPTCCVFEFWTRQV